MITVQSRKNSFRSRDSSRVNSKILPAAGAACLFVSFGVSAQSPAADNDPLDEVIVTATRAGDGIRSDLLGASFSVLSASDLEQRQVRIVSDVLRDVPGV